MIMRGAVMGSEGGVRETGGLGGCKKRVGRSSGCDVCRLAVDGWWRVWFRKGIRAVGAGACCTTHIDAVVSVFRKLYVVRR